MKSALFEIKRAPQKGSFRSFVEKAKGPEPRTSPSCAPASGAQMSCGAEHIWLGASSITANKHFTIKPAPLKPHYSRYWPQ